MIQEGGWPDIGAWTAARLIKAWKLVIGLALVGLGTATAIAFSKENVYEAQVTLVCQGGKGKTVGIGGDLDIGGLLGMGSGSDVPPALVQSVLKSTELALFGVRTFKLDSVWKMRNEKTPPRWENLVRGWTSSFNSWIDEENMLHLTFRSESPELAAAVLRSVVDWADSAYIALRHSHFEKNSEYLLHLVEERKRLLMDAEDSLVVFQQRNKLVEPEFEAVSGQKMALELQEQLGKLQMQMELIRLSSGEGGADLRQMGVQAGMLKARLNSLLSEQIGTGKGAQGKTRMNVWLEHQRLKREAMIHGAVFQVLVQQFEQAQLETRKNIPTFTVLDAVRVPSKKVSPPRMVIMFLGLVVGMSFGALFGVFGNDFGVFWVRFRQYLLG